MSAIDTAIRTARREGRELLLEPEAYAVLSELGVRIPWHAVVPQASAAARIDLSRFPGERVVVKVVSPELPHKSDVGGVAIVARDHGAIVAEVEGMARRLAGTPIAGFAVQEFVPHDPSFGGELLLGMRWTADFGPVVTLAPGGLHAEFLAAHLRPGREAAILSATLDPREPIAAILARGAAAQAAMSPMRGRPARVAPDVLVDLVRRARAFAARHVPHDVLECEINPLLLTERGAVAVDALVRVGGPQPVPAPARPLARLGRLLEPRSVAIVGVSERANPGRIILDNLLREGFDPERIFVIKRGVERVAGCPAVPTIEALPAAVDLFILAVGAEQAPGIVERVVAGRKAESLIVIPGGLGEREGSEGLAQRIRAALEGSRASAWGGPVLNGANCLGIRSRPGRYDTLFLPEHKLPAAGGAPAPLALISQSGALCASRATRLGALNPRYLVSLGNQLDLTLGDYLVHLKDDPGVEVFACYVEGFRALDGLRWLEAATEIVASGRTVILYRAGRTSAGARATASHTASIAGDYAVTTRLAEGAGVLVAETLADFDDLVRLACMLRGKRVGGWGLGAISNAGFECVAIADRLDGFRLRAFTPGTRARLAELLERCRLDAIFGVHNPFDTSPLMDDEAFAEAARIVLDDPEVDAGIVGCVPMTGALDTLPRGPGHDEDLLRDGAVLERLARLKDESPKPWVAVVDGGPLYDAFATALEGRGVPTFRTADRATRLFARYCAARLAAGATGA